MGLCNKLCPKLEQIDQKWFIILIEKGEIDLFNFIKLRVDNQIKFSLSEVLYVVITLFEFEIELLDLNIYLCDLKP